MRVFVRYVMEVEVTEDSDDGAPQDRAVLPGGMAAGGGTRDAAIGARLWLSAVCVITRASCV